ncbi:MAG: hypothetical protein Q8N53_18885, partial [Longimicrobiales bacterium]|nr:hypothetical protein [Longimicrobiales bacterium]
MEASEALSLAEEALRNLQRLLTDQPPGAAEAGVSIAVARAVGPVRGVVTALRSLAAEELPVEWCLPLTPGRTPLDYVRDGGAWEETDLAIFGRALLGRVSLREAGELRLTALAQRDRAGDSWEESFEVEEVSAAGEVTLLGGAPTLEEARRRLQRRYLARRAT